jgi:transposase-like protein
MSYAVVPPEGRVCVYCQSHRVIRSGYSARVASYQNGRRQRFKCVDCGRRFSEHFEAIFYRLKNADPALNAKIFYLLLQGTSARSIARFFFISEHCVRIRLERMARRALVFQSEMLSAFKIEESICFDGLENFAGSQYDPNNINHAIGSKSMFIYDFNYASLNRKGRISPWQKRRLGEIESKFGRYNPKSIREATKDILERLYSKWGVPGRGFMLQSDEHFHYREAIRDDLRHINFEHKTISSKACRNFQNILFPVTHVDLMIRQKMGAFSRETICFSKRAGVMCQRYALYMIYKNYMAPQFTKKHKRRPMVHIKSPAEEAKITTRILKFSDIFYQRSRLGDLKKLNFDWRAFWRGEIPEKHLRDLRFNRKTINQSAT